MKFISGTDRNQWTLLPDKVDDYVSANNPVRVIDAYVDSLDMEELGFVKPYPNHTGRPMYDPKDLLKLFLYGYINCVRSSRKLERETRINLEAIWLMKKLTPDHKTIARFRKDNAEALKNVFRHFVKTCINLDLYGKELIAVDGSKFKAWNTKDRNFTAGKLEDRIKRIDAKIESYLEEMNETDRCESADDEIDERNIGEIIRGLAERKQQYEQLRQQLAESDATQISLTDPDSRLMKTKDGLDVCFNVQSAVDSKHNMIAEFSVENQANDSNLLGAVAMQAAKTLDAETLTVVADAGYDSAGDIAELVSKGFEPHVCNANYDICIPCEEDEAEEITDHGKSRSVYIPERNIFICPMGHPLYPRSINSNKQRARYHNTDACKHCKNKCTASKYKIAERDVSPSEFSKEYDDKELHVKQVKVRADKELTGQRKSMIEHTFGTIKRALGFSYLLMRGKEKVTGEMSLVCTAFNMKRAINILGTEQMLQWLRA